MDYATEEHKLKAQSVGLLIKAERCITRGEYIDATTLISKALSNIERVKDFPHPPLKDIPYKGKGVVPMVKPNKPVVTREKGISDGYED